MMNLILCAVLTALLAQDEPSAPRPDLPAAPRRDLNEEEAAFLEVFSALARENRNADLEKHVKESLPLARHVFHRLDLAAMGASGEAATALATRMKLLGDWLDKFEKTRHWRRHADAVAAISDADKRATRYQALLDLDSAEVLYEKVLADWPDLAKQPECYELLEKARVAFEGIDDSASLARVHLLVAKNASTEKDSERMYREIGIARELWRKAGLPSDDEGSLWMIEELRKQQKQEADSAGKPGPAGEKPSEEWQRVPMVAVKDAKVGQVKTPAFANEDPRTWNDFSIGGSNKYALPERLRPFGRTLSLVRADDDYKLEDQGKPETVALRPGKLCPVTVGPAGGGGVGGSGGGGSDGAGAAPYTFLLALADKESLFGQNVSNGPTAERALIRWRSACHLEGELNGRKWVLYDDNDSGQFGDVVDGFDLYAGKEQGTRFADAVIAGAQGRAMPFSEYVMVDGALWRIKVDAATGTLLVQSGACGLGKLALDWAGPVKPKSLVVVGLEDRSGCFFDLAPGGEAVPVPTGKYRLAYGVLEAGKGTSLQRALILPGASAVIEVKDGATTTVALGAPFKLKFETQAKGGEAMVVGTSLEVVGRGGEIYTRFSEVLLPTVSARSKDNRQLARGKTMEPPTSAEWSKSQRALAYPRDFRVKADAADGVTFELELRAHPLLGGPITSAKP